MNDDDRTDVGSESDSGSADESDSGEEIPISTGGDDEPASDDAPEETTDDGVEIEVETGPPGPAADRRVSEGSEVDLDSPGFDLFDRLDESVVTLLSRLLDTETHLRVYVTLHRRPWSTPEAVAEITGLYPRTVREALAALESVGAVERRGPVGGIDDSTTSDGDETDSPRASEYAAAAPSAVLTDVIGGTGRGRGFPERLDLDRYLGSEPTRSEREPVRIDIEDDLADEQGRGGNERNEGSEEDDPDDREYSESAGGDGADGEEGTDGTEED